MHVDPICFPAETLQGFESRVFEDFGSAPGFVIVDTEANTVEKVDNKDLHHAHGMCQPMKALGGIGMGALMKLQAQGVKVCRVIQGTVGENIAIILQKHLPEFDVRLTCAGHTGGGCAH